jgi:hypothetical protein
LPYIGKFRYVESLEPDLPCRGAGHPPARCQAVNGCLDPAKPGTTHPPAYSRSGRVTRAAEQVIGGASGADEDSAAPVDVAIDWSAVSSASASDTTGSYTPASSSEDGGGEPFVPVLAVLGGLALLLLVVRAVRRRV